MLEQMEVSPYNSYYHRKFEVVIGGYPSIYCTNPSNGVELEGRRGAKRGRKQ